MREYRKLLYTEWKKLYNYSCKQWPDVTSLYGKEIEIKVTITNQNKDGRRWTTSEKETKTIKPEFYMNTIDAVPFFKAIGGKEKVEKTYTKYGLIPVRIVSTRPDGNKRTIREFKF